MRNAELRAVAIPFAVASALLLALAVAMVASARARTGGRLAYTLDDPYIHMAMARNLVRHGVWGVTRYEFSSSSSSPLWTLLLAASYKAVGVREWVPGAWALAFGALALYAASRIGRFFGLGAWRNALLCLAVAVFTPMAPLVSTGMEHTLHAALILFLFLFVLESLDAPGARRLVYACVAAALAAGVRYETLFVILPLAAVYALHRRLGAACTLVAAGCIVPALYAFYSVTHGSLPLPNSLMLKGRFHAAGSLGGLLNALGLHALAQLQATGHLLALVVVVLAAPLVTRKGSLSFPLLCAAFAAATLAHLQFASTGWFYRYEAYLVAAGTALAAGLLLGHRQASPTAEEGSHAERNGSGAAIGNRICRLALVLIICGLLAERGARAVTEAPRASRNIFEQQYQMGRFLAQAFPPGTRVAVNDLGAVAFLADVRVLDLFGLGSVEVVRAKRAGRFGTAALSELLRAHGTEYLILYKHWFRGPHALPPEVIEVATWDISDNVVCGGGTVTFFATSPERAAALAAALARFRPQLPRTVRFTPLLPPPAAALPPLLQD